MNETIAAKGMPTLSRDLVEVLKSCLLGDVIQPDDKDYDAVRGVYNGMIDRHPSMIVRCSDVEDVIKSVNFARQNDLLLAVRGGGHHGAGLGTCDGGMVIDLTRMKGIRVDPASSTVRVEGGCVWGEVDHAANAFGLAVPSGILSTTGVGGLTLGGGHGYLTRKYGLTIDNLLEADVVLANGRFLTASPRKNEDLFWALRGGGGNFGVVTSFMFQAHPVGIVYAGPTLWDIADAAKLLRWYREFSVEATEDLYGFFAFMNVPAAPPFPESMQSKTMCAIVWCYTGPLENAEAVFEPVRDLDPRFAQLGPMPFPALQRMFDPLLPAGLQWYWKGDFFNELSDEAIDVHIKYGSSLPTPLSTMHIYPIDGAAGRIGNQETAFSYRGSKWSTVIAGIDPNPENAERITAWATNYWNDLHAYSAGGAYVNFMMEEGQERVRATYRENYDRLAEVKGDYDPKNVFRVNQNVEPAASVLREVNLTDTQLTYRERGTGIPVILIHGAVGDYRVWDTQLDFLAAHYRVITYSRRHHFPNACPFNARDYNLSTHAADLAAFIQALGIESAHLVGHSYGAALAALTAYQYPALVRSLSLGEPTLFPMLESRDGKMLWTELQTQFEAVRHLLRFGHNDHAIRKFLTAAVGLDVFDQLPEKTQSMVMDNLDTLELMLEGGFDFPAFTSSTARRISVPTILITGERSPRINHLISDLLVGCIPNATKQVLRDTSHGLQIENPDEFNRVVLTFLSDQEARKLDAVHRSH
jgi:FAD/FMN-containing dehydrogenase/pimeloyl-ACP methyl ester carboxylesterase